MYNIVHQKKLGSHAALYLKKDVDPYIVEAIRVLDRIEELFTATAEFYPYWDTTATALDGFLYRT